MVSIRRLAAMSGRPSSVTNALPPPTSPPPSLPLVEPTLALALWVPPYASSVDINGPCQVNNSPWDVLELGDLEQFGLQEGEEDNGGSLNMNITELMDCKVVDGSEKKKPVIPKRKRSNKKNKKIAAEGWKWKEFDPGNTNYCNETDANDLLCGQPTNSENILCDFHIEQLILRTNRKYEDLDFIDFCATDPKSVYYYYDEFKPRKSKRRTCAIEDTIVKAVEEQMEELKVEEQTESVFVVPIFDDPSVGESTRDGMEEAGTKRKRGRKAMKPRSLSSILEENC